ncbi:hypothetical protein Goklo_027670 [Gossypium klotzschianum]|uniref:RING-type E3 ubiquitin transferase n=1 Tax=Gossypium klotzschianum TaxID=34286 RepID=A0A7J8TYY6_9ROSI|nr:hypothetical protein [Gossypium klotzschianum]
MLLEIIGNLRFKVLELFETLEDELKGEESNLLLRLSTAVVKAYVSVEKVLAGGLARNAAALVDGYGEAGLIEKAFNLVLKLHKQGYLVRKASCSKLLSCLCEDGDNVTYTVLQVESLISKIQNSSLDIHIPEIKHVGYEQESSVIKEAVWDRVGSVGPSSEILVRIAESLSLNSNMEILIEAVALEKLKENAEQAEITTEVECIDKLIALVTHMYRRLKWIDLGITVCPKTRKTLAHTLSIPNYTMKALIANGCETKNVKLPDPMESTSLNQVYPLRATEVKKLVEEMKNWTLFSLSVIEVHRARIGRFGAIQPLVDLLGNGTPRGKKDATSALFNLSLFHENKGRIVQAGMVDKAVVLLANLATIPEGRTANAQEGGIPRLVEVVELGSARGKEHASAALLYLCTCSSRSCSVVLQEGAVPPLVALSRFCMLEAQVLLSYFRNQRHGNVESD